MGLHVHLGPLYLATFPLVPRRYLSLNSMESTCCLMSFKKYTDGFILGDSIMNDDQPTQGIGWKAYEG